MKLVWSKRAVRDLISIGDYIARDNPAKARAQMALIRKRAKGAIRFPKSGRIVSEFGQDTIREFVLGNYQIVYELKPQKVVVLTVFEGHRLLSPKATVIQ